MPINARKQNYAFYQMKLISLFLNAVLFLAFFCQCSGHPDTDGYGQEYPMDLESYAAIDSCMSYMDSNPAQAHRMLDSVYKTGIMSPQRCHYLHAMVLFEGERQVDSALVICNRLLDEGKFGDDQLLEAEICELATNITFSCSRYIELLRYANRGIALCHGRERLRSDEATMMGRAGLAHQGLGQFDEAQKIYDQALQLLREDTSFGGFIALISLQKKQGGLYREAGDYDRVISVCHEILDQVERFDRDPSFVDPRPATMTTSGEATHGFADFYQTQMYNNLAKTYRMRVEQGVSADPKADRDSAAAYVGKWLCTDASHATQNMFYELPELLFTGHHAEFDAVKEAAGGSFGSDTLVIDYIEYLKILAQDAAMRNDFQASNGFLQRAIAVTDSIRQHDLLSTFSEQLSIHMVQQARLAQLDAEYRLSRNWILTALLGILLLASVVIEVLSYHYRRRNRMFKALQQNLKETEDEVHDLEQQLEDAKTERTYDNLKTLYQTIEQAVTENELYLNPAFDIRMLADVVHSSRTNISLCINNVTGKSFRVWLSEFRLNLFIQKLRQNPDESIDVLMARSGYQEQSTFRRQFKTAYGMTPGEYRKTLLSEQSDTQDIQSQPEDEDEQNDNLSSAPET